MEEEGTHDKLMANKGYYYSLVMRQLRGANADDETADDDSVGDHSDKEIVGDDDVVASDEGTKVLEESWNFYFFLLITST